MRVLVWGINYHPEQVGIAPYNMAMCEYLARSGYEVEMVTSFPYYPMWRKAPQDRTRIFQTDVINGVRVRRCWHFVPRRLTGPRRIWHELSFVATSTARALLLKRADVMVVVSPPLLLGAAAWLVGRLKGVPHVLHIQDLQPDAAVGLGMLNEKRFIDMLLRLERFNYRNASRVSVISQGMMQTLEQRGVERLVYFPNWIPGKQNGSSCDKTGAFRAEHGIGRDEFVLLYSGNIGMKQGFESIVEAAANVPEMRLVICGDGAARSHLEALVAPRSAGNVTLLPLQPESKYRQMMADADVCVICQRAGSGAAFFPSKLLSCVAFGKPVLAVADRESELAKVVIEKGLGFWAPPDDPGKIAEIMRSLLESRPRLEECARNGKSFAALFEESKVLHAFEHILTSIAVGPTAASVGSIADTR